MQWSVLVQTSGVHVRSPGDQRPRRASALSIWGTRTMMQGGIPQVISRVGVSSRLEELGDNIRSPRKSRQMHQSRAMAKACAQQPSVACHKRGYTLHITVDSRPVGRRTQMISPKPHSKC
jgi:hypothetical protein